MNIIKSGLMANAVFLWRLLKAGNGRVLQEQGCVRAIAAIAAIASGLTGSLTRHRETIAVSFKWQALQFRRCWTTTLKTLIPKFLGC